MADPNLLNPHPPEFDRFLYASVGEDRNGYVVTVLSTLASDHGRVAWDLSQLLPDGPAPGTLKRASSTVADGRPGKSGAIWAVLAIIFVLFQMFMVGGSGSGE